MNGKDFKPDLEILAKNIRIHSLRMTSKGGSSHIGSCFSIADILAVLYGRVLHFSPHDPKDPERDRFILSKGHAGAALYATLAEVGFVSTDILETHCQNGSKLCGHISHEAMPGIEVSTGSLGHGLSIAAGIAYAGLLRKRNFRVFTLLSDGECDEGSTWEAVLFAAHFKLKNLCVIIDYNKIQSLGTVADTIALEPFSDKWKSFGWEVHETDGHSYEDLERILQAESEIEAPRCIIAHTTKGKGVSFMENSVLWHYRTAKETEFDKAMFELQSQK